MASNRPRTSRSRMSEITNYQFPTEVYRPTVAEFQSPIRKQRYTLILACLTAAMLAFTVFFAYNSSLEYPVSSKLIFSRPERSILVLNIASQLTIFGLAELTNCVFEAIRWAFSCSATGTSAYTFLSLSRATNIIGVLCLWLAKGGEQQIGRDGHRLWGGQR
jgi:hypothetical protein